MKPKTQMLYLCKEYFDTGYILQWESQLLQNSDFTFICFDKNIIMQGQVHQSLKVGIPDISEINILLGVTDTCVTEKLTGCE
jgi:hypothetical protein